MPTSARPAPPKPSRPAKSRTQPAQKPEGIEQKRSLAARLTLQVGDDIRSHADALALEITTFYRSELRPAAEALAAEIVSVLRSPNASRDLSFVNLRRLQARVADIEDNCHILNSEIQAARARFGPERGVLRCLDRSGRYIPVARLDSTTDAMQGTVTPNQARIHSVPIDRVLTDVEPALSEFIEIRAAAGEAEEMFARMGMLGGIGGVPSNTYRITVRSPTIGARVSYSPCYFINYTVLASPTSPVHGYIAPGRYVFMVTTTGQTSLYDPGQFDIPPSGIAADIGLTV